MTNDPFFIDLPAIWTARSQQVIFRALLRAVSYPGTIQSVGEFLGGEPARLGILATLLDSATTFCDANQQLDDADIEMLECEGSGAEEASYVLFDGGLAPPDRYRPRLGDVYRPDLGSTILLSGGRLGSGSLSLSLHGPGIEKEETLAVTGFHSKWFDRREAWVSEFPMGVDFVLCDDSRLAALPRTTRIEVV